RVDGGLLPGRHARERAPGRAVLGQADAGHRVVHGRPAIVQKGRRRLREDPGGGTPRGPRRPALAHSKILSLNPAPLPPRGERARNESSYWQATKLVKSWTGGYGVPSWLM